jgi:hypothetical protein
MPPDSPPAPDLGKPDEALQAVGAVSLRLLAGAVPKQAMEQLRRMVQESPSEFPWQVVTQAVLAQPADPQQLVQQGLRAQRDWILRGGRETPRPGMSQRAKGLLARLCAQAIFFVIYTLVVVAALLLLRHKVPELDIYRITAWVTGLFGPG